MQDFSSGFTSSQKRNFFEEALGKWPVVQVHFLNHPNLRVPKPCRPTNRLITVGTKQAIGMVPVLFEYGLDLSVPISDLKITGEGIEATLSFSHEPYSTFVPWDAIVRIGRKFAIDEIEKPGQFEQDFSVRKRPKLKLVP